MSELLLLFNGVDPLVGFIFANGLFLLVFWLTIHLFYQRVPQGKALICYKKLGDSCVSFVGGLILPFIESSEIIDISLKRIVLDCRGQDSISCQDKMPIDMRATFYLAVNKTHQDVMQVAQNFGAAQSANQEALEERFVPKFNIALEEIASSMRASEILSKRDAFKYAIFEKIGVDLSHPLISIQRPERIGSALA